MVNVVMTALVYLLTMVMSYILKRAGLFHKEDKKVLSNLIFYITLPASLISSFAGAEVNVYYVIAILLGFLVMLGRIVLHRIRQAIDEQAQLENYKKLAYVDSLTGLFNYTAFKYMKSRWPERTDWTYIVMDINWLKQTNDQYGHRAGDELLCCAVRCIREAFYRAEDLSLIHI